MKVNIIAVGKRMPEWISHGCHEYIKRLPGEIQINLIEISPETRNKSTTIKRILVKESKKIKKAIPENSFIIVLDENGKKLNSIEFAKKLGQWSQNTRELTFVIGGADGLDNELKSTADESWSLSQLTYPHAMVRLIVIEQIYRAWSINTNHPYHRV